MRRRKFITGIAAASAIPAFSFALGKNENPGNQNYYEIIKYQLPFGPGKDRLSDFYKNAAIPGLTRLGIGPVGVFTVLYGPDSLTLYVLIQHKSLDSIVNYRQQLMDDIEFRSSGKNVIEAPFDSPAFLSQEITVLKAFKEMPAIEVPVNLQKSKSRIFELRVYQSHSYLFGQKKIRMFNEGGEIKIFRKTGLNPIFFGETILGNRMPNLHYMLAFENMSERDKNWEVFRADPDWISLKADPQYKDAVSTITDIILKPTDFSLV
jgi:hypothetical protein